nr:hypothetical protein L203_03659 [Cryptococcus depauperatus CBS 7841]
MAGQHSRSKRRRVPDSVEEQHTFVRSKRRSTQQTLEIHSDGPDVEENEEDEAMRFLGDEEPDEADEELARRCVDFQPEYERGEDGYVAGSVVRIKMTNFMTYDHVEFRPGPHLNMILGPNGTGKSSIAASIAIGLAFPPKVMGRANEIKSYVKQGHEEAYIEIELKGRNGDINPIICRKFNRHDEKSDWKLNRQSISRAEVNELVKSYGVQANNLCSFLPQDKVAEFAAMAPVTVLKETMRAAGDPRLTKWYERLLEKGDQSIKLSRTLEGHIAHRDRLQAQVNNIAPDVELVQEREKREHQIEVLQNLLYVSEHNLLKEAARKQGEIKEKLRIKIEMHESRRQPLKDFLVTCESKSFKTSNRFDKASDKHDESKTRLREALRDGDELLRKGNDINDELSNLRTKIERTEKEKTLLRQKIAEYQAILSEPRENHEEDVKRIKKEKSHMGLTSEQYEIQQRMKDKLREAEEQRYEYDQQNERLSDIIKTIKELSDRQKQLESVEAVKEHHARTNRENGPSIAFLLDWLKREGHTLEAKVHKPAMISVSVPLQQYAWQVENCTNFGQRATFICESKADYARLIEFNNKPFPVLTGRDGRSYQPPGKIQLYLAFQEVAEDTVNPKRPCTDEQLHNLGFDGFAIDFVDAAPAVIAFLSTQCRMHLVALTMKHASQINSDPLPSMGIRSWGTKEEWTRATQSRYGSKCWNEMSTSMRKPTAFHVSGTLLLSSQFETTEKVTLDIVDNETVRRTANEIKNLQQKKIELEEPHRILKEKIDEIVLKAKLMKDEIASLYPLDSLEDLQNSVKRYAKAEFHLEKATDRLEKLESEPSPNEKRDELKKKKYDNAKERLKPLIALMEGCDNIIKECADLISVGFHKVQNDVNVRGLKDRINSGTARTKRFREDFEEASQKHAQAKALMNQKWAVLKENISQSSRAVKNEVTRRAQSGEPFPPPEDIKSELNTAKAQLDIAINIPAIVVQRWEHLNKELEKASEIVINEEQQLSDLRDDIEKTLNLFNPALDALVSAVSKKFSDAFQKIKCSGEIEVNRVEKQFDQWGIFIKVAYRDTDEMAILTANHQSGGERSLATITYLMSLSEMSRTPFSLVDEINQGMDSRAERTVHNQLVEVTCNANAGQYFLITPKLLTGLSYHPKMKILTINNGVHLPDSHDPTQRYGDLKACVKKYRHSHVVTAC